MIKVTAFTDSKLLGSNCFLAEDGDGNIFVVDPSSLSARLKKAISGKESSVRYILITHGHFDHLLGCAGLKELCKNAKVVIGRDDADGLRSRKASLAPFFLRQQYCEPDILAEEGIALPFGGGSIGVLDAPGHTKGGVCYMIDDLMFCGDTILYNSIGRTDLSGGNYDDMLVTLSKIAALPVNYRLFCGHGEDSTLERERILNRYLQK